MGVFFSGYAFKWNGRWMAGCQVILLCKCRYIYLLIKLSREPWLLLVKLLKKFGWFDKNGHGRINHSGAPCQRKVGRRDPFLIRVARIFSGGALFPKKLTTFLVVIVTFKRTLNVQTSKQRGNNFAVDRGSHGTTGTVVNRALRTEPTELIDGCYVERA